MSTRLHHFSAPWQVLAHVLGAGGDPPADWDAAGAPFDARAREILCRLAQLSIDAFAELDRSITPSGAVASSSPVEESTAALAATPPKPTERHRLSRLGWDESLAHFRGALCALSAEVQAATLTATRLRGACVKLHCLSLATLIQVQALLPRLPCQGNRW
jgi:hypothetical protein